MCVGEGHSGCYVADHGSSTAAATDGPSCDSRGVSIGVHGWHRVLDNPGVGGHPGQLHAVGWVSLQQLWRTQQPTVVA
jgi:hypothetical protein